MANKQTFSTGAQRDEESEKLRYDLIPVEGLARLAQHYTTGAKHYGENNWAKGIPFLRYYSSILRHLFQWRMGDNSEDHLAAIAWGCMSLMHHEEQIAKGLLPVDLDKRVEGMYGYPAVEREPAVFCVGVPNSMWFRDFLSQLYLIPNGITVYMTWDQYKWFSNSTELEANRRWWKKSSSSGQEIYIESHPVKIIY